MSYKESQPLSLLNLRVDALFFWGSCFLVVLSLTVPSARYLSYAVPFGFVLTLLALGKFNIQNAPRPYLVILVAGFLLVPIFGFRENGIQDLYLILIGLTPFLTTYKPKVSIERVIAVTLVFFVLSSARAYISGDVSSAEVDMLKSSNPLESGFSFVFGLLSIVALTKKRYGLTLLCIFLTLLSFKRIAMLGVLVCTLIWLAPVKIRQILLSPLILLFASALYIFLAINFALGNFDRLIYDLTGSSANAFAMGRRELYYYPALDISRSLSDFLVLGNGPGSVYPSVNWGLEGYQKRNLHSDILKIFYEYGGVVLLTFLTQMFRGQPSYIKIIWLYTSILFLTDNVLIFPYYVFSVCLVTTILSDWFGGGEKSKVLT